MGINKLKRSKKLISLGRDRIDPNRIQGFILDASKELLLIQYVYDFKLDGLMMLRREDVTKLECTKTDTFQKAILKRLNLFKKIDFSPEYDMGSWHSFLQDAVRKHTYFIFEEELEKEPVFTIGKIEKLKRKRVVVRHFSGTARWERCRRSGDDW